VFPFLAKYCSEVLSYHTKTYHDGREDGQSSWIRTPDFITFCQPKEFAIGLCISREGLGKVFISRLTFYDFHHPGWFSRTCISLDTLGRLSISRMFGRLCISQDSFGRLFTSRDSSAENFAPGKALHQLE
jgi:hypothetical protein